MDTPASFQTRAQPIEIPLSGEVAVASSYSTSYRSEGYEVQNNDEDHQQEYEYADEDEFWEPASMEDELKCQLETLQMPIIKKEDLE